ncbi:hypothetical protein E4U55_006024 [Claviceps digitariae]|nr:hypothetical protein E4U55_006024 [Claviceps digitariae]
MATMKAVDVKNGKGDRQALFINPDTPLPIPSTGQALVKIKAFGINRMDILQRRGLYPVPPQAPRTLGVEFSGIIDSLGPGDHGGLRPGDDVFGLAYGGAYAEYIAVRSRMLLRKPRGMSFAEGAAVPEAWMTATQALHMVLGFAAGGSSSSSSSSSPPSILWHAGASGVGIAGIQLSRAAGASAVYATAGSDEKCRFLTSELGATAAFNYKTQDWVQGIKDATQGRGVDYIVDFVGADYWHRNVDVAARDGRIVLLGTLSGATVPEVDISKILVKRIRIEGSALRSRDEEYQGKLRDWLETYCPRFEAGELKIVVDKVLPWEEIQEAHKYMEEARNTGKIVCTIS